MLQQGKTPSTEYTKYEQLSGGSHPKKRDRLESPNGLIWTVGRGYRGAGDERRHRIVTRGHELYPAHSTMREWVNDGEWVVFIYDP